MTGELADRTAADLLSSYRDKEVSPVEVVTELLRKIEAENECLGAFIEVLGDSALVAARVSEQRWLDGTQRALEGVPFGLKDLFLTKDVTTTGGARVYRDWRPDRSGTVVNGLARAGGVLLGKMTTTEFALGVGGNPHFPPVRNPWDLTRRPGGSSTGPGAALAARQVPLALGTDTGGSVRLPAAYCGVSALKPTFGRVSRDGVLPLSWTLDHVGPMARTARDLALLMGVIAGPDPADPYCSTRPSDAYDELAVAPSRLRLGVPSDWFSDACDPRIRQLVEDAATVFERAGASLRQVRLPHAHLGPGVSVLLILGELATLHADKLDRVDELDPEFAGALRVGSDLRAVDYNRALQLRSLVQQDFADAFEDVDVLLTPATPTVAPRLDETTLEIEGTTYDVDELALHNTSVVNVAGLPALVVPAGLADGLPAGIQLVAPPFADWTCLRVGGLLQELTDHHKAKPPGVHPVHPTVHPTESSEGVS